MDQKRALCSTVDGTQPFIALSDFWVFFPVHFNDVFLFLKLHFFVAEKINMGPMDEGSQDACSYYPSPCLGVLNSIGQ